MNFIDLVMHYISFVMNFRTIVIRYFVMNSICIFYKFYESCWFVYKLYNHNYFMKIWNYVMNQKLIL